MSKDPLGLSAPTEYRQIELDSLDLNKAVNAPGKFVGTIKPDAGAATLTPLQPYKDAFGLARFRENELIHGRCGFFLSTLHSCTHCRGTSER